MVTMPYEEDKYTKEIDGETLATWSPQSNTPTIEVETQEPYWVKHVRNGHWSSLLRRIRNEYVGNKQDQAELDKMIQFLEELN